MIAAGVLKAKSTKQELDFHFGAIMLAEIRND
jgi:hypothetical protein